jgi:SpoVK/Ycf46/Vps4 family AAA+-type ATPase
LLEKGRGVVILFSGLPGTGKTMTAEAMAGALGRKLLVADYSQLESKWIGETEKNIVSVFRVAAGAGAVVLLDEADAILAGRLDGSHYNDRAYNRQVSLLLQQLEHFEGLCILTTNRGTTLDEGLARRIGSTVIFGVPGPPERERIWRSLISPRVPLVPDVDLALLAERYPLCGGHIKNIVVSALRSAARREGPAGREREAGVQAGGPGDRVWPAEGLFLLLRGRIRCAAARTVRTWNARPGDRFAGGRRRTGDAGFWIADHPMGDVQAGSRS